LFFAVQSMTSMNVLASTLDSHQHVQDWQAFARSLVAHRFGSDQRDIATFAQRFDQAAVFNAKALIILMVLAFAPVAALLFRISERSAGAHVVFALHIYTFVLVVLCIALGLAEMDLLLNGGGLASPNVDTWLTVANLAACAVYIYFAVGPAYRANGPFRFVAASILTATVAVLFVGYRFAIFVITFYTV
jgi:hypothetical protein